MNLRTWTICLPFVIAILGAACNPASLAEEGTIYANGGRDGVTYESCLLSNGHPIQHFALFDSGNFIVVASLGWVLDLDAALGTPNGIDMYEYSDSVECTEGVCTTFNRIHRGGETEVEESLISWTSRRINSEMDEIVFDIREGELTATCANFPVDGPTCQKVIDRMHDFIEAEQISISRPRISYEWCE